MALPDLARRSVQVELTLPGCLFRPRIRYSVFGIRWVGLANRSPSTEYRKPIKS